MYPIRIALAILSIFIPSLLSAQGVNFSMTLQDSEGRRQADHATTLRLSILADTPFGQTVYSETHRAVSNAQGVVHAVLGTGTTLQGNWTSIDWKSRPLYLKSERADDGEAFISLSSTRIGAVPYAYHADVANGLRMKSPDGSLWNVLVDNEGNLTTHEVAPTDAPPYGTVDYIFDLNALPRITIEISVDEWNTLLHNYDLNKYNEETVHANFIFEKHGKLHRLDDIGLRLRGTSSRVRPEGEPGTDHVPGARVNHPGFGFRFQKYHKDDPDWTFSGTDRFNLKWAKSDPTYAHEMYCYDLMRRFGVYTAPRASYTRVFLKFIGEEKSVYMGVCEMFECFDDQYLADQTAAGNFAGDKGFLWKGTCIPGFSARLDNPSRELMGIDLESLDPEESEAYVYEYKSKKKKLEQAKDQLEAFIINLTTLDNEEFRDWAEEAIDIDLLLRGMAVEAATGHWDGFWRSGNNFYFYFDNDGDGRFKFIPFDMDGTLGNSRWGDTALINPIEWGTTLLPVKVLSVPEWKNRFKALLMELCKPEKQLFDPVASAFRILKWHDMIRHHVKNDTGSDEILADAIPDWTETPFYRILEQGQNNYFSTRIATIRSCCQPAD